MPTSEEVTQFSIQQIIDDLDHAQLYMPDDSTMRVSLALASAMLVNYRATPPAGQQEHDLNCPMWMMKCECAAPTTDSEKGE